MLFFFLSAQSIHKELEEKIARFHQREDAILYASCFDANAGIFEVCRAWQRGGERLHRLPGGEPRAGALELGGVGRAELFTQPSESQGIRELGRKVENLAVPGETWQLQSNAALSSAPGWGEVVPCSRG